MKFFQLFTKTPSHHRFNFVPRYYDARKEELAERMERIKQEVERERSGNFDGGYRSRISGSFQQARRRSKNTGGTISPVLLRLGILLFITLFLMAYLTWGNLAFYSLILFVPLYVYLKIKKN